MDIKTYQLEAIRTLNYDSSTNETVCNMVMGINGEVGEVTDILKKFLFQGHPLNIADLEEEIGDVMFYIANLCNIYNLKLENILEENIEKLLKRYPNGFESKRSIER